jgi:hypothetical protein
MQVGPSVPVLPRAEAAVAVPVEAPGLDPAVQQEASARLVGYIYSTQSPEGIRANHAVARQVEQGVIDHAIDISVRGGDTLPDLSQLGIRVRRAEGDAQANPAVGVVAADDAEDAQGPDVAAHVAGAAVGALQPISHLLRGFLHQTPQGLAARYRVMDRIECAALENAATLIAGGRIEVVVADAFEGHLPQQLVLHGIEIVAHPRALGGPAGPVLPRPPEPVAADVALPPPGAVQEFVPAVQAQPPQDAPAAAAALTVAEIARRLGQPAPDAMSAVRSIGTLIAQARQLPDAQAGDRQWLLRDACSRLRALEEQFFAAHKAQGNWVDDGTRRAWVELNDVLKGPQGASQAEGYLDQLDPRSAQTLGLIRGVASDKPDLWATKADICCGQILWLQATPATKAMLVRELSIRIEMLANSRGAQARKPAADALDVVRRTASTIQGAAAPGERAACRRDLEAAQRAVQLFENA